MEKKYLYNSRIIDTYLKLLRARYPQVDIDDLLRYAGMKSYETADQGHWFTQQQIDLFYEKCVQVTANENIAREAGRFAASPGTLGAMRQYGLSLAGPLKAFSLVGFSAKKFTRSCHYFFQKINNHKVEIRVQTLPGIEEKPFQCENRIGFFEAMVSLFQVGQPKIDHPECMFRGDETCRYVITWRHNLTTIIRRGRDAVLFLAVVVMLVALCGPSAIPLSVLFPTVLVAGLSACWLVEYIRARELDKGMQHFWETSDQLADQIDQNYRNTRLAAEVGDIIANRTSTSDVIDSVALVLKKSLNFDRGLILLANETQDRLEIRGAYGYEAQHLDILTEISFNLENPGSRGMFVVAFREQRPFLVNDVKDIEGTLSPRSLEFVHALGTKSFLCVPIVLKGQSIGVLAVDNLGSRKPLLASDVNLLTGIAPSIAISLQNAKLLEDRAMQFDSTLQVMADSIDARDSLTAGHSEQVAEYSVAIASNLGLCDESCHVIRRAALLHDYGKIGIPDSILKKAGPLTEEERSVIRTHPTKTWQILKNVGFEGAYRDIPSICHAHHEKWDGTGYPNALSGEAIPLGARIIAAADFYEAITAERHYRRPMNIGAAMELLQKESGQHFQPEVVDAFIRYLEGHSACLVPHSAGKIGTGNGHRAYRTEVSAWQSGKVITGTSVHVGRNEIYIKSFEVDKLKHDEEIQVTFALPGKTDLVQLQGRVTLINPEPRSELLLPAGFTVQFGDMDVVTKSVLHRYLAA